MAEVCTYGTSEIDSSETHQYHSSRMAEVLAIKKKKKLLSGAQDMSGLARGFLLRFLFARLGQSSERSCYMSAKQAAYGLS